MVEAGIEPLQNQKGPVQSGSGTREVSYSWVPGVPFRGWSGRDVTLTTQIHKALRSRISAAIPTLPYTPSYPVQGQIYLYLLQAIYYTDVCSLQIY
jgi:hypothetical protein